jgi:glycosyltransferase involved in cell wall biosynthesis
VRVLGVKRHSWRWKTSKTLIDALRGGEYDGIHAHCFEPAIHASRARAAGAVPSLVVTHHDPHLTLSRRLLNRPYRHVPDAIVLSSASAGEAYRRFYGFDPKRMAVVPNPLPDAFFAPSTRDEGMIDEFGLRDASPILLSVSRVARLKGHADLMYAMRAVVDKMPSARLIVAGDGKRLPPTRELCTRLGLDGHVIFLGYRSDVTALLGLADIFVCPSHAEVLCTSLIEAMAGGKPIVTTAVWGAVDEIEDGVNGLLTPIRDPQALAEGMLRLADDPELARRLGDAVKAHAQRRVSLEAFTANMGKVYAATFLRERGERIRVA